MSSTLDLLREVFVGGISPQRKKLLVNALYVLRNSGENRVMGWGGDNFIGYRYFTPLKTEEIFRNIHYQRN